MKPLYKKSLCDFQETQHSLIFGPDCENIRCGCSRSPFPKISRLVHFYLVFIHFYGLWAAKSFSIDACGRRWYRKWIWSPFVWKSNEYFIAKIKCLWNDLLKFKFLFIEYELQVQFERSLRFVLFNFFFFEMPVFN